MTKTTRPSSMTSFLAIVRYELLWDIRKKKFLGVLVLAFVFTTLTLVVPVIGNKANNLPTEPNPNYVIDTSPSLGGLGAFLFFIFALVTAMNTISGEFESGSIVPLLTKPVSRTSIYLGKLFAAFLILVGAYVLLTIYLAVGGFIVYGPQNNLHLLSMSLLGSILSSLVWMAIILAMGSISKSSMLVALLGIGIWFGLYILAAIVSVFLTQAAILSYLPGRGAMVTLNVPGPVGQGSLTGTDSIPQNLITHFLNPSANVTYFRIEVLGPTDIQTIPWYNEPLSLMVARSIAVAAIYILVFNFVAWYAFKRAQILE